MNWLKFCVLTTALCSGGGVTKPSGIEQFWTDDYKIFEQVYGKTSDKEIYGATLPPNVGYGLDTKNLQASEKKERFINYQNGDETDNYNFGIKDLLKSSNIQKPSFNFISTNDFKPISQNSDPETYLYLKHLEDLDRDKKKKIPKIVPSFKPYLDTYEPNPEDTDAYKSIQEILDAHEANKGKEDDASSKYLTYREKSKPKKKPAAPVANKTSKPRCLRGRCRNRSSYRSRPRPYYRIKKRIVY